MTYCVAMALDAGLLFASDTRTNAGVDHIATFRKMTVYEQPGDRVIVLLTAGNLAVSQNVVSILNERTTAPDGPPSLLTVPSLFTAARLVGNALREVHHLDAEYMKQHQTEFNTSILLGGQIRGEPPRLFNIYAAGNFIEATTETPYFQSGEVKYGKPIIDRVITHKSSLDEAVKCTLISFDSTIRSNISVGAPIDLLCYVRDSLRVDFRRSITADDVYFKDIKRRWSDGLRELFAKVPDPSWDG
jgi:putative proteasome-type protease